MEEAIAAAKSRIRDLVRASRAARTLESIAAADRALGDRLRTLVEESGARSVSCYMSTPREPGSRHFLSWAASNGVSVLLPVSRTDGLLDWVVLGSDADAAFQTGAFGIQEPTGERLPPEAVGEVDLIIAPACAVDQSGLRLGWGRGYFDRTLGALPHLPRFAATVYDDELFESLPSETHDLAADIIVTPTQTLFPGAGRDTSV